MLFEEQISRKPNLYPWTSEIIAASLQGLWSDSEFSFNSDVQDFKVKLTQKEKDIVVRTLSAIAQIEVAVKRFWGRLGDNLPHPSIHDLGIVLATQEVIHNQAYERLLTVLGLEEIFEDNLKHAVVKNRVKYLKKWNEKVYTDKHQQYIYSIILFTLFIENTSLFSQFYIINYFNKEKHVLKDTNQQTLYTRVEEDLHGKTGTKIINTLREEYPQYFDKELVQKVIQETHEALEAESKLIDWILGKFDEPGLNAELLKEFIKYRLNTSLERIGFPTPYEVSDENINKFLWFDEQVIGSGKTDFFHERPIGYVKFQTNSNDDLF